MFGYQLLLGTFAIVLAVIGHAGGLVTPAATLKKCSRQIQSNVIILTIAILGVVFIHTIEAWAWACLYFFLGEFEAFSQALCFSVVTATTLGYGDALLSERWQILGSFEAMSGMLLFGASTAFLLGVMRHLLPAEGS